MKEVVIAAPEIERIELENARATACARASPRERFTPEVPSTVVNPWKVAETFGVVARAEEGNEVPRRFSAITLSRYAVWG